MAAPTVARAQGTLDLEMEYDRATDLLSIRARQIPLNTLLQEIAKKSGLTVESRKEELLRESVSVEMKALPLEQALRQLLREFNSALLYSNASAIRGAVPATRLVGVVLLSKKERAASQESLAPSGDPGTNRIASVDPAREKEKTTEALLRSLESFAGAESADFSAYLRALNSLKDVAPERVVDPLVNLLLRSQSRQIRVHAASTLGEIADRSAIDPLAWAFRNDEDRLAQQAAMYSLVRIGGERALEPVFRAFGEGNSDLQQAIALALARKGDEKARERLAAIIASGRVSEGVATVWRMAYPSAK